MEINDDDVAFAMRQVWKQLAEIRASRDRDDIRVLAPRCCGFISALSAAGVIRPMVGARLHELAHNVWTHANQDARSQSCK